MTTRESLGSAFMYLRTLQEAQFLVNGIKPITHDEAWVDEACKKLRARCEIDPSLEVLATTYLEQLEALRATILELPTPYVNPHQHRILVRLVQLTQYAANVALSHDFKERYRNLILNPPIFSSRDPFFSVESRDGSATFVVSTLPTGEANARVIRYRQEPTYFVLFETQLFSLLNLVSKCVAPFMRDRSEGIFSGSPKLQWIDRAIGELNGIESPDSIAIFSPDAAEFVQADLETQAAFGECLVAAGLFGNVEFAQPRVIDAPLHVKANMLLDSAELFLVGHEYAHALLSHLNPDQLVERNDGLPPGWSLEYDADALGLDIASEALRATGIHGNHHSASFISGHFALLCIELLEKIETIVGGEARLQGLRANPSHPPARERINRLEQWLERSFSGHHHMPAIRQNLTAIEAIVGELWSLAGEPAVRETMARLAER